MLDWMTFEFTTTLWRYEGQAAWHFVTLPGDVADQIDEAVGERGGFGSVPVEVTVGSSVWKTSLFPDKRAGSFVLPIKNAIRVEEGLEVDAPVAVRLRLDPNRVQRPLR
jgi:hypothetical protein